MRRIKLIKVGELPELLILAVIGIVMMKNKNTTPTVTKIFANLLIIFLFLFLGVPTRLVYYKKRGTAMPSSKSEVVGITLIQRVW